MGLWIGLGVGGAVLLLLILMYNRLVRKRMKVRSNFEQIKVLAKKRFDLIPNLVAIVKGYAKHERELFDSVVAARNSGTSAGAPHDLAAAEAGLTNALGRLFALSEAYPDLKASTNFLSLQGDLKDIEKAISISRQIYNDSVMRYNAIIATIPFNIVAGLFRFKSAQFYEIAKIETENVRIEF
ncbi:MAG: LemA family protein [Firmicutes bacterium]|nr:LemA family protein [Bacillota bacterium]